MPVKLLYLLSLFLNITHYSENLVHIVMHCTVVLSHKWFLLWFTYRRTPKFFHWFAGGFSKTIPFGYRGKQNLPCSQIVELYDDGSCLSIAAAILLTPTSWNLFIICIIKSFSLLV